MILKQDYKSSTMLDFFYIYNTDEKHRENEWIMCYNLYNDVLWALYYLRKIFANEKECDSLFSVR